MAAATRCTARIVGMAVSSARPSWFETTMPAAPDVTAVSASAVDRMPFTSTGKRVMAQTARM